MSRMTHGFPFRYWITSLLATILTSHLAAAQSNAPQQSGEVKASAQSSQADVRKLEVGKPIEREMRGGESHTYKIALLAGQYLNVIVDQRGIDVVAQLIAPDGKQVMEVDSPNGTQGPEPVEYVSEAAGLYQINVTSLENAAPVGRYEIKLDTIRAATENDRALQEAIKLNQEVDRLLQAGKYDEALPKAQRALKIFEEAFGPEHPKLTVPLYDLALLHSRKGDYGKAEPLFQRALAINERAYGPEHLDVASMLNGLAALYENKQEFAKAEPLYQRALAIYEKVNGPQHPYVATMLSNLATFYSNRADYAKAEPLYQRALAINEKVYSPEHSDVAAVVYGLAGLYHRKGDFAKAEPLYQRALAIYEKVYEPQHPFLAAMLNSLGLFYFDKGNYAKAESLYQRAMAINEKVFGADHPKIAVQLNNLAMLYYSIDEYAKAESLYQRALAISEKAYGQVHPSVAAVLNGLALLYSKKGDYEKAEPLYERAVATHERLFGAWDPDLATMLNNFGELYSGKGEYAKAEALYRRALDIYEKSYGSEHPDVANSLITLGNLYVARDEYAKAEPLYQRALEINEKVFGRDHPDTATSLLHIAQLSYYRGDYARAQLLIQQSLQTYDKVYGTRSISAAVALNSLAEVYQGKGDMAAAIDYQFRCNEIMERDFARNLLTGSERQRLLYVNKTVSYFHFTLSFAARTAPNNLNARRAAMGVLLQRKGRGLDATVDAIAVLRRRATPENQRLIEQLINTREQLSREALKGPGRNAIEKYRGNLREFEAQAEKIENELSQRSIEFRVHFAPVTFEAVQNAMPTNAALVEFATYRLLKPRAANREKNYGEPRYVACVLRHQGEPAWVELGEAKAIDSAIDALRQALRDPSRKDVKQQARAVEEKVFRPVRQLLGNTRRVLLSPDGALNLIPFAALVDDRDQYLLKQYSFSYLTSGRDLLRLQVKTPSKQAAIVVADPDFGGDTTACLDRKLKLSKGAVDFSRVLFCPLTGTAGEAQALQALLPDATVLVKQQATEAAVKQVSAPKILHIATHGFFLEDVVIDPVAAARGLLVGTSLSGAIMKVENPLLRSGLAMAGANLHKSGDDDGVLTALEVSGLDLWGTKLVVLSACDTGVGEVKNGDGVYGLRRALVLAGSESQVMSLWSVNDEATRDLMIDYYTRLQAGAGRAEALRQVQLKMLASKDRQHPYYWASFIESGEWANLDGKR